MTWLYLQRNRQATDAQWVREKLVELGGGRRGCN